MTMRGLVTALVVTAGAALPAAAQELPGTQLVRDALVTAAGGRYLPAFCSASKGLDNRANFAQSQLKIALEDKDAAKRAKALDEAVKNGFESAKNNPKVGGSWYYYGRAAILKGDLVAADSAFTRAVALVPDCETDVDAMRQNGWAAVTNAAIDALNAQRTDEAIGLFRTANLLFRKRPEAMTRLAVAYANTDQVDSAIVWFSKAIEVSAADTSLAGERAQARLNLGAMYQRKGRHADAVPVLEAQLKETPQDVRVIRALAASYRETGKAAEAAKLEAQSRELGKAGGEEGVGAADLFNDAVNLFNEKKFGEAAELFGKVLELEPNNRDALFNQANSYLGGGDAAGLVKVARKLIEREPYGEVNHRLLIQGLRDLNDQDAMMKAAEVFLPLPVNVEIKNVNGSAKGGLVSGSITGREAKDLSGKVLAPAAMTLVFRFVDNTGSVVATTEVAVPALPAGQAMEFKAESGGKGFVGYTYGKK